MITLQLLTNQKEEMMLNINRYSSFLTLILLIILVPTVFSTDFVNVNQADVLVITHSSLRTNNWTPDMEGAWETELLDQKDSQGLSVAIYQIGNGVNQTTIKTYIDNNDDTFQYILILGDARRPCAPEDDEPSPLTLPTSNFTNGNVVPIWREVVNTVWYANNGQYVAESDNGYIDGLTNVSIGRIPAKTSQEIRDYIAKADDYLTVSDVGGVGTHWSHYILEVLDDKFCSFNNCSGINVQTQTLMSEQEFPTGWPVTTLATSTGPASQSDRADDFEDELNDTHHGLIHVLGTTGNPDNLVNWYYDNSDFDFTNIDYLPFMLGLSCELGGFDQYDESDDEIICVIEELLLDPDGGIIGSVTAPGATSERMNGIYAWMFWQAIFDESVYNFGQIMNRSLEKSVGWVTPAEFQLKMLTLLGDPTLSLPYGDPFPEGQWTTNSSPVMVTSDITIAAGAELIIDPGVEVLIAEDKKITVNGTLTCSGTSADHIVFKCSDSNEQWDGLVFNEGSEESTLDYIDIENADIGIYVNEAEMDNSIDYITADGCNTGIALLRGDELLIQHCDFTDCTTGIMSVSTDAYASYCTFTGGDYGFWSQNDDFHVLFSEFDSQDNSSIYCQNGNGDIWDNTIENSYDGIKLLTSSPSIIRTHVEDCTNDGLILAHSSQPVMNTATGGNLNRLANNGTYQIYIAGYLYPLLQNGHNDLIGPDTYLISTYATDLPVDYSVNVDYNWWDDSTPRDRIHPADGTYFGHTYQVVVNNVDTGTNTNYTATADELLAAIALEANEEYLAAVEAYKEIIEANASSSVALTALQRIFGCYLKMDGSFDSLKEYYLDQSELEISSFWTKACTDLSSYCDVKLSDFTGAIDYYEEVLQNTSDYLDALYAELDIESVGFEMSLGGTGVASIPFAEDNEIEQFSNLASEYQDNVKEILSKIASGGPEGSEASTAVPGSFALHKNYPNPFNPETVIGYDVPELANVKLEIFNVLGQKVCTLVNNVENAGFKHILWNGQSKQGIPVSSGMYIYRLTAEGKDSGRKFNQSCKMILLQ